MPRGDFHTAGAHKYFSDILHLYISPHMHRTLLGEDEKFINSRNFVGRTLPLHNAVVSVTILLKQHLEGETVP